MAEGDTTPKKATGRGKASTGPKQAPLVPTSVPPGAFDEERDLDAAPARSHDEIEAERKRVAPPIAKPEDAVLKTGFGPEDGTADLATIKQDDGETLVTLKEAVYEEVQVPGSTRTTHRLAYAKGQQVPRKVLDAHRGSRAAEDKRADATEVK